MNGNGNSKLVHTIVQAGAVGLALVSIVFLFMFATRTVNKNTETGILIIESQKGVEDAVMAQTSAILKVFGDNDVVWFGGLDDSSLTTDLP